MINSLISDRGGRVNYLVMFKLHATQFLEVEADSEEEAKEIAENQIQPACVCHHCANEIQIDDIGEIIGVEEIDD